MGAVAKSYMRKGFLIYEEMRKYLTRYEKGVQPFLNFLIYEENLIFFFLSVNCLVLFLPHNEVDTLWFRGTRISAGTELTGS
jgi:hypothetical protein